MALVAVGTATSAAIGTAVAAFVLAEVYVPTSDLAPRGLLSEDTYRSMRWVVAHDWLAGTLLVAATVALVGTTWQLAEGHRTPRQSRLPLASASLAIVAAWCTITTAEPARWDQRDLWAVQIGTTVAGAPRLHDGGPDGYGVLACAQLAAPILGGLALLVLAVDLLWRRGPTG